MSILKVFIYFLNIIKIELSYVIILLHNLYELYQMNNSDKGYIYIRWHSSYDVDDVYKMGKTTNIPERGSTYATGELKRGKFAAVFEVPIKRMGIIERLLQDKFRDLNVKYDTGTEFYKKEIIPLIEPHLITLGILYKNLSKQEISDLERPDRVRKTMNKINIRPFILTLKSTITNEEVIIEPKPKNKKVGKKIKYFTIVEEDDD